MSSFQFFKILLYNQDRTSFNDRLIVLKSFLLRLVKSKNDENYFLVPL